MLNSEGFDLWADNYDESVGLCEEADEYPFAGYKKVLNTIYQVIRNSQGKRVLDVGFGTGVLSQKLYDDGYFISGVDFSEKMIAIAAKKMPDAKLCQYDFAKGLPEAFAAQEFDFIVCTYAIHHLSSSAQIALIKEFIGHLSRSGKVIIADVAFDTLEELADCREKSKDEWDADEIYLVREQLESVFPQVQFRKISFCAGIFLLEKGGEKL